jgi:Uncharacterised protein family (UPF0158)
MGNNPGAQASHQAKVRIKFSELLDAFTFSSASLALDCYAYINLDTGAIYLVSDDMDVNTEQEMPDDLETSERYLPVPHKNDLELGRTLVFSFVEQALPDDYDMVRDIFRSKGAYGRFKDFLDARAMLQNWYDYEARMTEEALRSWCKDNDIEAT